MMSEFKWQCPSCVMVQLGLTVSDSKDYLRSWHIWLWNRRGIKATQRLPELLLAFNTVPAAPHPSLPLHLSTSQLPPQSALGCAVSMTTV